MMLVLSEVEGLELFMLIPNPVLGNPDTGEVYYNHGLGLFFSFVSSPMGSR